MTGRTDQDVTGSEGDPGQAAESGQGLAEYALIIAFVTIVCIAALTALGVAVAGSPGFNLL